VVPLLALDADNSTEGRVAPEVNVIQAAIKPLVEAIAGGGDALATSCEKIVPPPPSAGRHETEVSAMAEASMPTAS
jgi:hypothetical protein